MIDGRCESIGDAQADLISQAGVLGKSILPGENPD